MENAGELSSQVSIKTEPDVPASEFEVLFAQLKKNPHEPKSWRRLVALADESADTAKIRTAYDALLQNYPNTSAAQIRYLNHFLANPATHQDAEDLFRQFLKNSPSVELCRFYLTYIRRKNSNTSQRDTIRMAFEYALNHVGQDKDSGDIWSDYIQFLNSGEATSTWEQQQKMDSLRRVYHRAVQIPLDNLGRLWEDLESFEMNLNKITAKKFLNDLNPSFVQARTTHRELCRHMTLLYPSQSQQQAMYLPSLPTFSQEERTMLGNWRKYLRWEESNPLLIDDRDRPIFISRMQGIYRKAVIRMRYFAEIWFMAYTWLNSVGKQDEAMNTLKAGMEANPKSFVLTFAYAEAQELLSNFQDVHDTYTKFLGVLKEELEELEAEARSAESSSSVTVKQGEEGNSQTQDVPMTAPAPASNDKIPKSSPELNQRRTEYGLVWIMYMKFGRRAEGERSSRAIFAKARRDKYTTWEVYEAAAMMEYHRSEDKTVPSKIFEKGMEFFADEVEYVERYLGFLITTNDENNARALFERVITTFPSDRARPLWARWSRYEYLYGDLQGALRLERRMADAYPSEIPLKRFAQRYIYLGTDAIASRDLGVSLSQSRAKEKEKEKEREKEKEKEKSGGGIPGLSRMDNAAMMVDPPVSVAGPSGSAQKRPASPDYRKGERGGDYAPATKRSRTFTPPPPRGESYRDRGGRWEGPSQRRYSPPPRDIDRRPPPPRRDNRDWDRDRDRGRDDDRERERDRPVVLPPVVGHFLGQLPSSAVFDGPVFRTDDLMNLFRGAVIPSSSGPPRPRSPIMPPRSGGRPMPDYGPYPGPGGRSRRY